MTSIEIISLIAGLVSVILGGFALFLSVYFFINTKGTETKVATALESIKAQTDALQKITLRQVDRLTKYATDNSPYSDILAKIIPTIPSTAHITEVFTAQLELEKAEKEGLIAELVNAYIGMYQYCAVTNVIAQGQLPPIEHYEDNLPVSEAIKEIVNRSYGYFYTLKGIFKDRVHETRITASPFNEMYQATETNWAPLVKDATQVYAERGAT